jgi:hypothetical protein
VRAVQQPGVAQTHFEIRTHDEAALPVRFAAWPAAPP